MAQTLTLLPKVCSALPPALLPVLIAFRRLEPHGHGTSGDGDGWAVWMRLTTAPASTGANWFEAFHRGKSRKGGLDSLDDQLSRQTLLPGGALQKVAWSDSAHANSENVFLGFLSLMPSKKHLSTVRLVPAEVVKRLLNKK